MKKTLLSILAVAACATAFAASNGIKVYINPGHGGYDSNDRNVVIEPYSQGDPAGYWESKSNLSKGLQLRDMLQAKGYTVEMSRTTNTSDDDLNLSTIVALSNKFKGDVFFSIHSNATGTSARRNFPLMLYRGYDNEPQLAGSLDLCKVLNRHLLENEVTYWTATTENCRGDWSFYKEWGTSGLGALRGQTMTSMLSEGSFHDYIPEAYRLMNDDFCWLEAYHFRRAIDEYFNQPGESVGHIYGRLNDARVPRDASYLKYGDDTFATIQGATVELYDADGKLVDKYVTDAIDVNGVYGFKNLEPGTYTVKTHIDTHYDAEKTVEVKADLVTYANFRLNKVRSTAPQVIAYAPLWNDGDEAMLCNSPIVLEFNWDMDTEATEAAFSISPAAEGTITWEDTNHRMIFTPSKAYSTSTMYTVTLGTGACHPGGLYLEKPVSFSFFTTDRNFMDVLGYSPRSGDAVHYHGAAIEMRFDMIPYTTNILKQVTCKDSQGNDVAFNNRGLVTTGKTNYGYGFFRIPFKNDLTPGETYTISVSGELADRDGITIQKPISYSFTATDWGADKASTILLEMDNHTYFNLSEEQSAGYKEQKVALESTNSLFGKAVSFNYTFNDTKEGEILWSYSGAEAGLYGDGNIGVHIYGDLSSNQVYLYFASATQQIYVPIAEMDFLGWRYIEVPLSQLGTDEPFTFQGVKLVQTNSQQTITGTFAIDRIYTTATSGINTPVAESAVITVGPNPASEYIVATGDVMVQSVVLYDYEGRIVKGAAGNVLYVGDVTDGYYIARASTAGSMYTRKITVKH